MVVMVPIMRTWNVILILLPNTVLIRCWLRAGMKAGKIGSASQKTMCSTSLLRILILMWKCWMSMLEVKEWSWWCIMRLLHLCVTMNVIWMKLINLWKITVTMRWRVDMLAISSHVVNTTTVNGWIIIICMQWRKLRIIKLWWMHTRLFALPDCAVHIRIWLVMNLPVVQNMKPSEAISLSILRCFHLRVW